MFNGLKDFFWRRKFARSLQHSRLDREVSPTGPVKSMAVYYAYEDDRQWKALMEYLSSVKSSVSKISVLVYDNAHAIGAESIGRGLQVMAIDEKDLDFCSMLKTTGASERVAAFFEPKYDLFADFSRLFHKVDAGVSAMVRAKVKIGKCGQWNTKACDMTLSPEPGPLYVKAFAEAMETYSPMLIDFRVRDSKYKAEAGALLGIGKNE